MENQNRNNRVHTEEQPGKADFQIAEVCKRASEGVGEHPDG